MNKIIEKLHPFLPAEAYVKASEMDENSFELIDVKTNEEIGSFSLNENGELVRFTLLDEPEPTAGTLTKDKIAAIAEKFINIFYPGQKEHGLSSILDVNNLFMITYEKKDEKYGLFLHSTGFTVSISKAGQIISFYRTEEKFSIRYSDILVTEEAALEKYVNGLDFELMIQQFDKEVYKNGDNQYHLAYSVIEQVMDIPVDGSEAFSIREEH